MKSTLGREGAEGALVTRPLEVSDHHVSDGDLRYLTPGIGIGIARAST